MMTHVLGHLNSRILSGPPTWEQMALIEDERAPIYEELQASFWEDYFAGWDQQRCRLELNQLGVRTGRSLRRQLVAYFEGLTR